MTAHVSAGQSLGAQDAGRQKNTSYTEVMAKQRTPIQISGVSQSMYDIWRNRFGSPDYRRHFALGWMALRYDSDLSVQDFERLEDAMRRAGSMLEHQDQTGAVLDCTGALGRMLRALGPEVVHRLLEASEDDDGS